MVTRLVLEGETYVQATLAKTCYKTMIIKQ